MSTLHKADCTLHWSALGWSLQPVESLENLNHLSFTRTQHSGGHWLVKYSSQSRSAPFYTIVLLAALWLWKLALISPSISPLSPCHLVSAIPFTKCPALSVCMLFTTHLQHTLIYTMCDSNTGCHQAGGTSHSWLCIEQYKHCTGCCAALWAHAQLHSQPGPKVEKSL